MQLVKKNPVAPNLRLKDVQGLVLEGKDWLQNSTVYYDLMYISKVVYVCIYLCVLQHAPAYNS